MQDDAHDFNLKSPAILVIGAVAACATYEMRRGLAAKAVEQSA